MTTVADRRASAPPEPPAAPPRERWLAGLIVWHGLLGVAAFALLLGLLVSGARPEAVAGQVAAVAVLGGLGVANALTAWRLSARRHLGRSLSLAINYLGFLACTALLLHVNRVFVGVDALGATFARGVPFLLLAVVGYVLTGFRDTPDRPGPLRRVGRWVMLAAAAGFLLAVGIVPGIVTFVSRTLAPVPLALLAGAVVFGLLARFVWSERVGRVFGESRAQRDRLSGMLLVSPNLLGFLAFFAGPLLLSLYVSFNDWDAFGPKVWIGLDNYIRILSLDLAWVAGGESAAGALREGYRELWRVGSLVVGARDVLFWTAMRNVLLFSAMALPLAVVPALLLATLLNAKAPGMRVFRALYFIPTVAGVVGVTLIWKQLLNATVGYVNYAISQVVAALNVLPGVQVADPRPAWLSDADLALFSLVIVFAWQYIGYNAVLFLAGLQNVPADLYEAAHLDGANRWQRFRNITLPQLRPTTFFVVATTGILALQLFTESVILFANFTPPGSGPNNAALTPVAYLYQEGFQRFSQGYASAVAWVLFLFIFAFTFIQFQRQRREAVN